MYLGLFSVLLAQIWIILGLFPGLWAWNWAILGVLAMGFWGSGHGFWPFLPIFEFMDMNLGQFGPISGVVDMDWGHSGPIYRDLGMDCH